MRPLRAWHRRRIAVALISSGTLVYLILQSDLGTVAARIGNLPMVVALAVLVLLILNLGCTVARLHLLLRYFGAASSWPVVLRASLYGALGALALNIFGQIAARAASLKAAGVPRSSTVVMSLYERAVVTVTLFAMAATGAVTLHGHVKFDLAAGGFDLVKLAAFLLAAVMAGAWFGYPEQIVAAARAVVRGYGRHARRSGRVAARQIAVIGVTLAAHALMLSTYVLLILWAVPSVELFDCIAASAVVMFAAALPISFAGWGIRELSAVYAYGTVGVPTDAALAVSMVIGGLSTILVLGSAAIVPLVQRAGYDGEAPGSTNGAMFDAKGLLARALPLAAATLVFFQVRLPTEAGGLNVNLADPVVIFGGGLALAIWWARRTPGRERWQFGGFEAFFAAASAVIAAAWLHGWIAVGWVNWAFYNRLVGWGVLLAYVLTGAVAVIYGGAVGQRLFLKTIVVVGAAMVGADWIMMLLRILKVLEPHAEFGYILTGVALNPNAFAFQILVVLGAGLLLGTERFARDRLTLSICTSILLAGVILCGSRAGLISGIALFIAVAVIKSAVWRTLLKIVAVAAGIATITTLVQLVPQSAFWPLTESTAGSAFKWDVPISLAQRRADMFDPHEVRTEGYRHALRIWQDHPIAGAGLGAYVAESIEARRAQTVIHNTPLWLLAETGLIGFGVFAAGFVWLFATALRPARNGSLPHQLILWCLCSMALMAMPHEMSFQRIFWLIIGVCAALPFQVPEERDANERGKAASLAFESAGSSGRGTGTSPAEGQRSPATSS